MYVCMYVCIYIYIYIHIYIYRERDIISPLDNNPLIKQNLGGKEYVLLSI